MLFGYYVVRSLFYLVYVVVRSLLYGLVLLFVVYFIQFMLFVTNVILCFNPTPTENQTVHNNK